MKPFVYLDDLVEELKLMGLKVNQEKFRKLASEFESAEGLSEHLINNDLVSIDYYSHETDVLFGILNELWRHWIPERFSTEMLEENIWRGYDFLKKEDHCKCCMTWLEIFPRVWEIMAKCQRKEKTGDPFEAFGITFFNWIQDLIENLWNLGLSDPFFHHQLIAIAEAYLQRCPEFDSFITENFQAFLGETYFHLGDKDKADALFDNWLKIDPTWGWGWIRWSDCYSTGSLYHILNNEKAINILKKALTHRKVREKDVILDRLEHLQNDIKSELSQ